MRPLTLTIQGLRSYKQPVEVDFRDRNLVAIVGDTGAGKSSLLEGITFALFGASTWSGHAGDLIGDHSPRMIVELTFTAAGDKWKATRAMSRTNYPPTVHQLERWTANGWGDRIDGKSAVNDRVQQLVGLDRDAFLRTVILPQGRFAELLTATEGQRNQILENIFRVDELKAARERIALKLQVLEPKHGLLKQRRSFMLPDPTAAATEAEALVSRARARALELADQKAALVELTARLKDETEAASAADRLVAQLEQADAGNAAARLAGLAEVWNDLQRAVVAADGDAAQAAQRSDAARSALATTKARVGSDGDLALAATTLRNVAEDLPRLMEWRNDAQRLATDLEAAVDALSALAAEHDQTIAGLASLEAEAGRKRADAADAAEALRAAEERLSGAREARSEIEQLTTNVAAVTTEVEAATAALLSADDRKAAADAALAAARVACEASQLAAHLEGGDDCPICHRPLPENFTAPEDADVAEAQNALRRVEVELRQTTTRLAGAEAEREVLQRKRDEAEHRQRDHLDALGLSADNGLADDAIQQHRVARDRVQETAEQAAAAFSSESTRVAEIRARREAAAQRHQDLEERHRTLARQAAELATRCTERLRTVAEPFRPTYTSIEELSPEDTLQPVAAIEHEREALQQLETQAAAADAVRRSAEEAAKSLRTRLRQEVEEPMRTEDRLLERLRAQLANTGQQVPAAPLHGDVQGMAAWASVLADLTETAVRAAEERAAAARQAADRLSSESVAVLTRLEVSDVSELDDIVADAKADERRAQDDLERAREEIPMAADLDDRIHSTQQFLAVLRELKDLLADGKFIKALIRRRQQALLGVATTILGSMTHDRYGFSADFQVVDTHSGQPRSTRTLSGGESFVASMALALAMVELAARAGGRLDALFLDEGFGSLDTASLDAALDALEARAHAGRLVAVITHVSQVKDRIPDVLTVRAAPSGTAVAWADSAHTSEEQEVLSQALAGLLD